MLNCKLDADLERILEADVNDLARYNILLYLHDSPNTSGNVAFFSEKLGLRSHDRTIEALEALASRELLTKREDPLLGETIYSLNGDPDSLELVDRLYNLKYSAAFGEIVERLAARSLHKAKQARSSSRGSHRNGHK